MAASVPLQRSHNIIRLLRVGCTNRPFYKLVVQPFYEDVFDESTVIEQVGTYDPMPNQAKEKLVGLNFDRLKYWLGTGVRTSKPVDQLLGLCGFFPIHPMSFVIAKRNREKLAKNMTDSPQENAVEPDKST